jgi:ribonucleoside-diphosphate reductase alpha chain
MIQLNPKYTAAYGPKATDKTPFFEYYCSSVDCELHSEAYDTVQNAEDVEIWPQFSIDAIKFLPGETLTDLLLANAQVLARKIISTYQLSDSLLEMTKGLYYVLAQKKISLAGPFFNNLRRKDRGNLASCFILEVEDSRDSIAKALDYCSLISKSGGGIGLYLGLLRSQGASIGTNINAAQSIAIWCKLFDQLVVSFNQLGARPGAMTIALPIWHADIEDFLEIQTEAGDLAYKSFNIQSQVCLCDGFMQAVLDDSPWNVYCPKTLRDNGLDPRQLHIEWARQAEALGIAKKTYSARELWGKIQKLQMTLGRPYLFFQDAANSGSPFTKNFGPIQSANLCVESYSFFKADEYVHTCNLVSVNVGVHTSLEEIQASAETAALFADLSHDMSKIDILEVNKHVKDFRTIGVGIMGLADWLAANSSSYGDTTLIEHTAKAIAMGAYIQSLRAAEFLGPCEASCQLEPSSVMLALEAIDPELKTKRKQFGIRNALMLCTAPNTSTSLTMGACPSFLPPYRTDGWLEDNGDKATQMELRFKPKAYASDIQSTPPEFVLGAALAIQKWTDAGISCEFLLVKGSSNATNKAFSDLKVEAWLQGLKAVYYLRSAEAGKVSFSANKDSCSSGACSN